MTNSTSGSSYPRSFRLKRVFLLLLYATSFWSAVWPGLPMVRAADLVQPSVDPKTADDNWSLQPSQRVPSLRIPHDLELDLVLQEPVVANPLYLNFDERGQLWVVQYRQYPWPAGLKLRSRDSVWRNVYDPPYPPPPPHAEDSPFRGEDRITIHQDTDGDGIFDRTKVFLDGLNFATAALKGRGGVFVMNPPYLLFYPDEDNNDEPDRLVPDILLFGFGIEDSHSIANSLRWGPDGWIYGAQGSTVSGDVVRTTPDGKPLPGEKPVHTLGQNIWRYHPERRIYEVFAEGGGNTFGVEIDNHGRLFSGHNGGDTRGFHYIQGGYYRKNFGKHGDLSNPFAFAHYDAMRHHNVERFTHTFCIYEAEALPPRYHGTLFGVAPNVNYVVCAEVQPDGSSLGTRDLGRVITPGDAERDDWFTPVDIQMGPDGALYIADWYSVQANHYRNHEGQTNPDLGRVYRLRSKESPRYSVMDLGALDSPVLVEEYLDHPNRWYRQTALRLLGDRHDPELVPLLESLVHARNGSPALYALWALYQSGGWNEERAVAFLSHRDAHVRRWTIRLLGDDWPAWPRAAAKLISLAAHETDVETRSQLASTALRIPNETALPIIATLARRGDDTSDIHIPNMLWWALEAHAEKREEVLALFATPELWQSPIQIDGAALPHLLLRRYALAGQAEDLRACARLFEFAPDAVHRQALLREFVRAFEGRTLPPLPEELARQLASLDGHFAVVLGIRQGDQQSIRQAGEQLANKKGSEAERAEIVRALGDARTQPEKLVPLFLKLAQESEKSAVQEAALSTLGKYQDPQIGARMTEAFDGLPEALRPVAASLLASRAAWARDLMAAIDRGSISPDALPEEAIARLRWHQDSQVRQFVSRHFPEESSSVEQLEQRIDSLGRLIREAAGDPLKGREIYHGRASCGKCHRLYGNGGDVGPDLTPYHRHDLRGMLLALVHPSAEVREGFENYTVVTLDGQVLGGLKLRQDERLLMLKDAEAQVHTVPMEEVDELLPARNSLMPEGLLDGLDDQELRDLFAFLSSTTPPQ